MRLLLAGGGTGGHLFPAVALAERLRQEEPDSEVLFVGTERGIEAKVLPELEWPLATVDITGFSGQGALAKLEVGFKLMGSVMQGMRIINNFSPDIVIGVGGYASAPLVIAARLKRVPVVLHEQNAVPGLTNRLLGRWADRVCISFDETSRWFDRAIVTGNPLREGLEDCPGDAEGDKPVLLVFGGSRGARAINETFCAALPGLQAWQGRLEIVHQTGEEDLEAVRKKYSKSGWDPAGVTPFIKDMAEVYRRAHLVLCRAGATTVAELTACGRAAILIPYPYAANDHQKANAEALAQKGAALMIEQDTLNSEELATVIKRLLNAPAEIRNMARVARSQGRPGAAEKILAVCRETIGQEKAA